MPSVSGMGESFGGLFTICGAATKNPSSSSSGGEEASWTAESLLDSIDSVLSIFGIGLKNDLIS